MFILNTWKKTKPNQGSRNSEENLKRNKEKVETKKAQEKTMRD